MVIDLPHKSQAKCFKSACILSCILRWLTREHDRPQVSQLNGFTHVCVHLCIVRVFETVND